MKKNANLSILVITALMITACGNQSIGTVDQPAPGFTPQEITLKEVAGSELKELMDEKLVFVDSAGIVWTAPKGTYTDGASVPRLALFITNGRFEREFLKAAVIHDAYCQTDNADRCPDQYRKRSWKDVHRMFYEALIAGGTSHAQAKLMFAAVWLAGPRWGDLENQMSQVPNEVLMAEFESCKEWLEQTNPSMAEIEEWIVKREAAIMSGGQ